MTEEKWCLYRHISPSNKVYIGITSMKPQKRWGKNGYGYRRQVYFNNAIKKYGWDNFVHEVLYINLPEYIAKTIEVILVKHYRDLGISYNVADGGGIGTKGYKWTKEQLANKPKRDMSGVNNPNYGNHKIAGENNFMYGKTHTEEAKEKIRKAATGRTHTMPCSQRELLIKVNSKPVIQLSPDNCIMAKFDSATAAARFYGKSKAVANHIMECCRGIRKKCINSKWIYDE